MNLLGAIGQAKPVSEFINTAGQYQTTQSNLESQRLAQQKAQMEAAQLEKDSKEYDLDAVVSMHPKHQQENIRKLYLKSGIVDLGTKAVRGKDVRNTMEHIKNNPDIALSINQSEKQYLLDENARLANKPDPESKAKMIANAAEAANLQRLIDKQLGDADKSYTLKEGETRFGADNQPKAYGPPKEKKVVKSYYFIGGDGGEYQVDKLENGTFVNSGTDIPYEGDFSALKEAGGEKSSVDPVTVRTFEAAHPDMVEKRGTPEYGAALQAFIDKGERPFATFVGTTQDGKSLITHDSRKNVFQLHPIPGGGQMQPKIAPTIPTEQTTAFQQIGTLKEALGQVTDLYEDAFVGPVSGPAGKVADNWGIMPNAKRAEFRALTANLYNTIIYLRSGKQINEEEAKRLLDELPTMNISPIAFKAKLKKFTWELNSIERGKLRQLKGAGYRNVGIGSEQPFVPPVSTGTDKYLGKHKVSGKKVYERPDGTRYEE